MTGASARIGPGKRYLPTNHQKPNTDPVVVVITAINSAVSSPLANMILAANWDMLIAIKNHTQIRVILYERRAYRFLSFMSCASDRLVSSLSFSCSDLKICWRSASPVGLSERGSSPVEYGGGFPDVSPDTLSESL